jgi:hypothetical protein
MASRNPRHRIPTDLGRHLTPNELRQIIIDAMADPEVDMTINILEAVKDGIKRISGQLTEAGEHVYSGVTEGLEDIIDGMNERGSELTE